MQTLQEAINQRKAALEEARKLQLEEEARQEREKVRFMLDVAKVMSLIIEKQLTVEIPFYLWEIVVTNLIHRACVVSTKGKHGYLSIQIRMPQEDIVVLDGIGTWKAFSEDAHKYFEFHQFIDACIYAGVGEE